MYDLYQTAVNSDFADHNYIDTAKSLCENNVAQFSTMSTYYQLEDTCVKQNVLFRSYYNEVGQWRLLNKYTDVGCCQSWVHSNLFPGLPLPDGYAPLSICPASQYMKVLCPQPSNNVVPVKSLLKVCDT